MKRFVIVCITVILAVGLAFGGYQVWSIIHRPSTLDEKCSATVGERTTTVTIEQAVNGALISGISIKRDLPPRAASIALTTVYQESGMRNLDYGHSDSLGLFQQRPSQGWGTEEEVMDPWYSSAQFYKALVKVKKWDERDLGDVAQAVQRSAYPDAYDKHIEKARTLASSLAGETPASFTCAIRELGQADPDGLQDFLTKTYGKKIQITNADGLLTVSTETKEGTWSTAELAIATAKQFGVTSVTVGAYSWTHNSWQAPNWVGTGPTDIRSVSIAFSVE